MLKAIKAIQRSYQRGPLRQFVMNQKQFGKKSVMSKRDVAMKHTIKEPK